MSNTVIQVHPLTNEPTAAWSEIFKSQKLTKLKVENPTSPTEPNKIRVVCMSDTHSFTDSFKFSIPDGDIFVHAGDFTMSGQHMEVEKFNQWIAALPHKYKLVISGNHELSFDENCDLFSVCNSVSSSGADTVSDPREYLKDCIYLQDAEATLFGVKFYGAPWQPEHGGWAFNVPRGQQLLSKWNSIPTDVDVLITHGPPLGHGDLLYSGQRAGCVELLSTIQRRVKPKYHIFGHIHEAYGVSTDGSTVYINASICNLHYVPTHVPIVFDIPLPDGKSKH